MLSSLSIWSFWSNEQSTSYTGQDNSKKILQITLNNKCLQIFKTKLARLNFRQPRHSLLQKSQSWSDLGFILNFHTFTDSKYHNLFLIFCQNIFKFYYNFSKSEQSLSLIWLCKICSFIYFYQRCIKPSLLLHPYCLYMHLVGIHDYPLHDFLKQVFFSDSLKKNNNKPKLLFIRISLFPLTPKCKN